MMLGDVLAVVAGLVTIFLTTWALMLGCGLLFEEKAAACKERLEVAAGKSVGQGALILLTLGLLSFVFAANPLPFVRLLGWMGILTLLAMTAIGSAGLSFVAGHRVRNAAPELSPLAANTRGAALIIAGSLVPIIGWFAFLPAAFCASLGAGWAVLVPSRHRETIIS